MAKDSYRFSFGPWNIHEGADPFGPPVRPTVAFSQKLKLFKKLGFDGIQFHDDDAVPYRSLARSGSLRPSKYDHLYSQPR